MKNRKEMVALVMILNLLTPPAVATMTAHSQSEGIENLTIHKDFGIPVKVYENTKYHLEVNGTNILLRENGRSPLPIYRKTIYLPLGSKIIDIEINVSKIKSLPLDTCLEICESERWFDSGEIVHTNIKSTSLYPEKWLDYRLGGGIVGNKRFTILTLDIYPIRYNLKYNIVEYIESADVNIIYLESKNKKTASDYDLLIITPSKFVNDLKRLAEHKNSTGIKTYMLTLENIYSAYNGLDAAEKIKVAIKDMVERYGIRYVLLVGSVYDLPTRYTHFVRKWGNRFYNTTLPTDLYYADLYDGNGGFSSWDTNNNGIFGEIFYGVNGVNDDIDLYPDVYLGRIACRSSFEVKVVVDKIIHYEKGTGDWFRRLLVIGGDTFPDWGVIEGEFVTEKTINILSEFTPTKIWATLGNLNPLNIHKELSRGYGFIHYSGHGFEYGFATHPINSEEWIGAYYTPYAAFLTNLYKLPIIFFDACLTAKLDFNSSDLRDDGIPIPFNLKLPCFAWFLVSKPMGGAIATIGATRVAFTHVDSSGVHAGASRLALNFFSAYQNTTILGEMFAEAQIKYIENSGKDFFTLEEFVLLGDPSLRVGGGAFN